MEKQKMQLGVEELTQMLGLYKGELANANEKVLTYQALILKLSNERDILQEQVGQLQQQILLSELNVDDCNGPCPVESCPDSEVQNGEVR